MRAIAWLLVFVSACGTSAATTQPAPAAPTPSASAAAEAPLATPVPGCAPTQTTDTAGVITANGVFGVVGVTFAFSDLLNGGTAIVRRGATFGDELHVRFDQLSTTAPATWVAYGVPATFGPNPWGDVVFRIGWKPIAFNDSCWRVVANGMDTGIVLGVGH